jgi:ribosomal protein L21E
MAKGKNSKSSGKVSAGVHSNVSKKLTNALKSDYRKSGDRLMNQLIAYKQGKRVMITIENPNKNETNKRFIRVPASTVWRDYKSYAT